ncbi:MAG: glycine cleavage system aminomethyltransferase GcvT [Candidatus Glassbacteria bacterium]|nr:glycine cleavage system aminomethyltransferase GcvT [Candidatus Glassbacteria bacterium]
MSELKKTPLYDQHLAVGSKIVPFAGWRLPVSVSGIIEEHEAVRGAAGMFDVSHMGRFRVCGQGAAAALDYLTTGRCAALEDGKFLYTMLLREDGGVIDDLLVGRERDGVYLVVVNAANADKDLEHMEAGCGELGGCSLEDITGQFALVALQGPDSRQILKNLLSDRDAGRLEQLAYYWMDRYELLGEDTLISRTGYTGELGYEIFVRAEKAGDLWRELLESGVKPCGLGARDTLRLEMGYALYGHELDSEHTPLEAGLGWTVDLSKDDFIGKAALVQQKAEGIGTRLRGLKTSTARQIPRPGYGIRHKGKLVANLVSGGPAPSLGAGIGTAFLPAELAEPGTKLEMELRKNMVEVEVVRQPFYRQGTVKA